MPWPLPPYQLAADAADGELDPVNWPWRWSGAAGEESDPDVDLPPPVYSEETYTQPPEPPSLAEPVWVIEGGLPRATYTPSTWDHPDPAERGVHRVYGQRSNSGPLPLPPADPGSLPHVSGGRLVLLAFQGGARELMTPGAEGLEFPYHWRCRETSPPGTPVGERTFSPWVKETFSILLGGHAYRTELSSAVAPQQNDHGKTRPGYDLSGGGAITFRLAPGTTDWHGETVVLSEWTAAQVGGPNTQLPRINPVLRLAMFSDDRFYDEATDTDHEGTGYTRWEITLRRGLATPSSPGSPEAPLLLDFGWGTGKNGDSAEAQAWNDSHHRGLINFGLEGEWDPEAHPWFRMRLPTADTMTFEKSADGVTWMRLYSAAVADYSMPFGEPDTEATRDGVMDIHPINNARVTLELGAAGDNPALISRYRQTGGGTLGDRYWRAEFDHFTIGGESVLVATRVVQGGAWVLASPRVAQGDEPPPWVHATPSVL